MFSMTYNLPGGTGQTTMRTTKRTLDINDLQYTGRILRRFGVTERNFLHHISMTYSIPGG